MRIGLTGNIGSGKTTVAKKFEALGVPVFYADNEAKKFYQDPEVIEKIVTLFNPIFPKGQNKVVKDGKIDFKVLADIIFSDKESLKEVNSIIHPLVMKEYNKWHKEQNTDYTILESAIIFENDLTDYFDMIITVCAPIELRIERVMKRDGVTREEVLKRMENQLDEEIKRNFSLTCIENDGRDLDKQVNGNDAWLKMMLWRNCLNCKFVKVHFFMTNETGVNEYHTCDKKESELFNKKVMKLNDCEYWENKKMEREYKLKRLKNVASK